MTNYYAWNGIIGNAWSAALREKPNFKALITYLREGTKVRVIDETDGWLLVTTEWEGKALKGYIKESLVNLGEIRICEYCDFEPEDMTEFQDETTGRIGDTPNMSPEWREKRDKDKHKFEAYPKVKESSSFIFGARGVQATKASSLVELGVHSIQNYDVVYLEGSILKKISNDEGLVAKEWRIRKNIKKDERYLCEAFYRTGKFLVGFGGKRWQSPDETWSELGPKNPLMYWETWKVAGNELTWALRHATVKYWAEVYKNGDIRIRYRLNDTLDLSGSKGRGEAYNNISNFLGFLYHRLVGGNINLQTRAEWTNVLKAEKT